MSDASLPPSRPGMPDAVVTPPPGDAERDAWLRAALRHAPDADASPPEALRRSILDEARAAAFASAQAKHHRTGAAHIASTRRPNVVVRGIAAFWRMLARPPVAAAFASVMAATLVGVMWWDRPLDEILPSATPPVAAVRPSTSTTRLAEENSKFVPATPASPATPPEPAATSTPSTSSTPTPPSPRPVPSKPPVTEAKRAAAAFDRPLADKRRDEAAVQSVATPAARLDAARVPDAAATVAAAPRPFPTPVSPASLAKAAPRPPSASPPPPDMFQGTTPSSTSGSDALARAAPSSSPGVVSESPAPAAALRPESRSRAAMGASAFQENTRPLADVLGALADDRSRWSVQRSSGERVPVDDAVRAWLARVDSSGRWRPFGSVDNAGTADAAAKTSGTVAAAPATTVTLLRDGRIDTVIRIGAGRVIVERPGETAKSPSTVVLPAQAAAALADSFPSSAR